MGELLALAALAGLASWRITSLLYDEAPMDWFRGLLGILGDKEGPVAYPDNLIGKTFDCGWCLSLVVTFVLSVIIAITIPYGILQWFLLWMGSATIVIASERWIRRSKARW